MKKLQHTIPLLLALFSCMGIVGCDFDNENGDSHEIKTCEVSAHKVMKSAGWEGKRVPHFELIDRNGDKINVLKIKGFDEYEEGFKYKVVLKKTHLSEPPQDGPCCTYTLVKILSKVKVTEAITLQSGAIVERFEK